MINRLVLKIKRRENGYYTFLYKLAKSVIFFSFPCVKPVHLPLYYLNYWIIAGFRWIIHSFWSVPLFKARCEKVGRNLSLPNGIPLVQGGHLRIFIGDNVTICRATIDASKLFDEPVLKIGDDSTIGFGTVVSVSKSVEIGSHCLIGPGCMIMDSDDHPLNPEKRLLKEPVRKEETAAVRIGNNVWIGSYSAVLKGVTIGDNTVVATHSVVTRDAEKNCVYAGFPARPTMRDIDRKE
jgi:acetyltransferase-like isoleucine patch superfamily enzyme